MYVSRPQGLSGRSVDREEKKKTGLSLEQGGLELELKRSFLPSFVAGAK